LIDIGLANYVTVWVANGWFIVVADDTFFGDCLAVELVSDINARAEVLPEAWTETWHRVEVVERIIELVRASLPEGRIGDVDVAAGVIVGGAISIDSARLADADVVLDILGVA